MTGEVIVLLGYYLFKFSSLLSFCSPFSLSSLLPLFVIVYLGFTYKVTGISLRTALLDC